MADETKASQDTASSDAAADGSQDAPAKKGKALIILFAIILILGGAAAVLAFTDIGHGLLDKIGLKKETPEDKKGAEALPPVVEPVKPYFFELPSMMVNLTSHDRKVRFMKIAISLVLSSEDDTKHAATIVPLIVDQLQTYLRQLTIQDVQQSTGLHELRQEILTRINAVTTPMVVKDVLFKEMVVQ